MTDLHYNANVEIRVLPHPVKTYGVTDIQVIKKLINDNLLLTHRFPLNHVIVRVNHKENGAPESLIVYLAHAYTYTYETAKIDVDDKYGLKGLQMTYDEGEEKPADEGYGAVDSVDMVFATPVPDIPTALAAVKYLCKFAAAHGFNPVMLLGQDATIVNYQKYLVSHLKAFCSIGHGSTTGILLYDGPLTYRWFQSLPGTALSPEVIYFNSCEVFNPPLEPSIMNAGARTFIGGITPLLIGPSEEVCKCFWTNAMPDTLTMGNAIKHCEAIHYPNPGSHGIAGDTGYFIPKP